MNRDYRKFTEMAKADFGLNADDIMSNIEAMTPYILEEREMRVTQMDVFSRLMMDRIIWLSGAVGSDMADIVQAQLLFMDSIDKTKDITLYINTPGGSVLGGLGIVDVMDYVTPDIATTNLGMCASMGSVLLAAGTKGKRSSLKYSKVMTHQVSSGASGNVQDNRINHRESERYNFLLFKRLGADTGKGWEKVLKDSERDRWYNSFEAKEYGLIDNIILPNGSKGIEDEMKGFDKYMKLVDKD